jgi:hypothetical protein
MKAGERRVVIPARRRRLDEDARLERVRPSVGHLDGEMDVPVRIEQIIRQPRAARHDDAVKFELGLAALENFIGKHLNFEEVLRLSAPRG